MTSFRSRTLSEYLLIIWRRKLLVFLLATGMLISTFLVIDRLPNIYESRATVVTSGASSDRQAVNARVAAATERLTSRAFLEPIISRYDPYNGGGNIDADVAEMRQDLKVETTYRSDFPERLTIAYRHTDPALAKDVATDLVSVFGKMNEAVEKQTAEDLSNLASQIGDVENRLREMGKLRAATAARQKAAGRAAGAVGAERAQRIASASSIETLTDKQFASSNKLASRSDRLRSSRRSPKWRRVTQRPVVPMACCSSEKLNSRRSLKTTAPNTPTRIQRSFKRAINSARSITRSRNSTPAGAIRIQRP